MKSESRTKKAMVNTTVLTIIQIATVFIRFITQTIFIYFLGKKYLGLNGLFSNILSVLSFADLGIGTSIVFSLYSPLARKNKKEIAALMELFRKAYIYIGIVIAISGIILIPFLPHLIKDYESLSNVTLYYVLYLSNSVVSYFFTYKRSILIADQKEYISSTNQIIYTIIQVILQSIVLLVFRAYSLYLVIAIVCTVGSNISISRRVDREYTYLKKYPNVKVRKEVKNEIKRNIFGMVGSKIGSIVVRSTDSLLLSAFLGVKIVGIYSNYLLIITSISNILNKMVGSVTASVGNLIENSDARKVYEIYNIHFIINLILVSITSGCILVCINPFITLWAGKKYVLIISTTIVIVANYFFDQLRQTNITFISAYGLFVPNGKKSVIEAVLNLILSIFLLRYLQLGISGVLLGTILTNLLLNSWFEVYILCAYGFKQIEEFKKIYISIYLKNSFLMFGFILVISQMIFKLDTYLNNQYILMFFMNGCIMLVSIVVFIAIIYRNNTGYRYLLTTLKKYL